MSQTPATQSDARDRRAARRRHIRESQATQHPALPHAQDTAQTRTHANPLTDTDTHRFIPALPPETPPSGTRSAERPASAILSGRTNRATGPLGEFRRYTTFLASGARSLLAAGVNRLGRGDARPISPLHSPFRISRDWGREPDTAVEIPPPSHATISGLAPAPPSQSESGPNQEQQPSRGTQSSEVLTRRQNVTRERKKTFSR